MEEGKKPQTSLEEWGKELDEEIASFEDILTEEPSSQEVPLSWESFQQKLEDFISSKKKGLCEEIMSECGKLSENAGKDSQIYLKILNNLVKPLSKSESVSELFTTMTESLPSIISSETAPSERKTLIQNFYRQYQDLKTKPPPHPFTSYEGIERQEMEVLLQKIVEAVEVKLHEINIKIEENQRALHQLIAGSKEVQAEEEKETPPETFKETLTEEDVEIEEAVEAVETEENKVISLIPSEREVTLQPKEWVIVALSQKQLSLSEIARQTKIDINDVLKIADGLEKQDLVRLYDKEISTVEKDEKYVPPLFWKTLTSELTPYIGPVAESVIEDEIESLGNTKERFPYDKTSILIEQVSREIDEKSRRIGFQKKMIDVLKRM